MIDRLKREEIRPIVVVESLGFTGTRSGMKEPQRKTVEAILWMLKPKEVHHGDCIGADAQFHEIARKLHLRILVHPPDNPALRANCLGGIDLMPKPYRDRNVDIVQQSDFLLAAPSGPELDRSGTWMTVRIAKGLRKLVYVIYPEGNVEMRQP